VTGMHFYNPVLIFKLTIKFCHVPQKKMQTTKKCKRLFAFMDNLKFCHLAELFVKV